MQKVLGSYHPVVVLAFIGPIFHTLLAVTLSHCLFITPAYHKGILFQIYLPIGCLMIAPLTLGFTACHFKDHREWSHPSQRGMGMNRRDALHVHISARTQETCDQSGDALTILPAHKYDKSCLIQEVYLM